MTILILGSRGQVARELARLSPESHFLGRDLADLAEPDKAISAIQSTHPDAVINAAAYTAVDRAETEEALAFQLNATAPGLLARACAELAIPFVHISTDYVFDGSGNTPRAPNEPTAPLGAYGRTKLAGEEAVRAVGGCSVVLRTSWVFSAHGQNFVKTMLRLGIESPKLRVVSDQIGGPTPAHAIAAACLEIAEQLKLDENKSGLYHLSGTPDVSWSDFAREIFALLKMPVRVEDIPSSAYPTPAPRPANSRLDCASLMDTFGIRRPEWKPALQMVLDELK